MTEPKQWNDAGALYLDEALRSLRGHKRLAEGALSQLTDDELFRTPDAESNSIAVIVQHIAGNQRSRFTDFLTTDGEKPDRNRDAEFEPHIRTREELLRRWEAGWEIVFNTLVSLTLADLQRTVTLRGEPLTVLQAIHRATHHYAYHVGQIAFLAKHWKSAEWKSLSIPKKK